MVLPHPYFGADESLSCCCWQYVIGRASGPVIIAGIHLCGTLALKAISLFNRVPSVSMLCLKPCCLPGRIHAAREEVWRLGSTEIDAVE